MKIFRQEVPQSLIPSQLKETLPILEKYPNLVIRGGAARLILLEILNKKGHLKDKERLDIERNLKDLDIYLLHKEKLEEAQASLIEEFESLREELPSLQAKNVDTFYMPTFKEFLLSESQLRQLFRNTDLTLNQVILRYEISGWQLFYSDYAWRDVVEGIAVINSIQRNITFQEGVIIPNTIALWRLFRFLVEGKVKKVWFPRYWLELYLNKMRDLFQKGSLPTGAFFGEYGLIILHLYKNSSPILQERWLKVFRLFNMDFKSFEEAMEFHQKLFPDFVFSEKNSFSEFLKEKIASEKRLAEGKIALGNLRENCEHDFTILECKCNFSHSIEICSKCLKTKKYLKFPCNKIFLSLNWKLYPEFIALEDLK